MPPQQPPQPQFPLDLPVSSLWIHNRQVMNIFSELRLPSPVKWEHNTPLVWAYSRCPISAGSLSFPSEAALRPLLLQVHPEWPLSTHGWLRLCPGPRRPDQHGSHPALPGCLPAVQHTL